MREIKLIGTDIKLDVPEDKNVYEISHDGYSVETTFDEGLPSHQIWRKDGILHREGESPTFIAVYKTWDQPLLEMWHLKNRLHRATGPARRLFSPEGQLIKELWYLEGEKVPGFQDLLTNFSGQVLERFLEDLSRQGGTPVAKVYDSIVEYVIQNETLKENLRAMKGSLLKSSASC